MTTVTATGTSQTSAVDSHGGPVPYCNIDTGVPCDQSDPRAYRSITGNWPGYEAMEQRDADRSEAAAALAAAQTEIADLKTLLLGAKLDADDCRILDEHRARLDPKLYQEACAILERLTAARRHATKANAG